MNYTEETFKRMNLQQIREFLLYGVDDDFNENTLPYEDRLKLESDPIYSRLHSIYTEEDEYDQAATDLSQALSAYESVYMEIGMQAGARLIFELLHKNDNLR